MDSGTIGGLESGGGEAVAGTGDKVLVADSSTPTPVTFVDNTTPTPVTVVDNSTLPPDLFIPIPQDSTEVVGSTDNNTNPVKNLQIAINFSGVELGAVTGEGTDLVQVSISFGFSNLNGQSFKVDCTTSVPISGGTSAGDGRTPQGRISSGGGGKTH